MMFQRFIRKDSEFVIRTHRDFEMLHISGDPSEKLKFQLFSENVSYLTQANIRGFTQLFFTHALQKVPSRQ